MSSKSKRLRSVEGLTHRAERRQSHPPDTDSRLLTEIVNRTCRGVLLTDSIMPMHSGPVKCKRYCASRRTKGVQ